MIHPIVVENPKKIERVCGHICFDAKLGGTVVPIFILIKSAKSNVAVKMVGTRYRQYLFKSSVASFVNLFHSRIEIKVHSAETVSYTHLTLPTSVYV